MGSSPENSSPRQEKENPVSTPTKAAPILRGDSPGYGLEDEDLLTATYTASRPRTEQRTPSTPTLRRLKHDRDISPPSPGRDPVNYRSRTPPIPSVDRDGGALSPPVMDDMPTRAYGSSAIMLPAYYPVHGSLRPQESPDILALIDDLVSLPDLAALPELASLREFSTLADARVRSFSSPAAFETTQVHESAKATEEQPTLGHHESALTAGDADVTPLPPMHQQATSHVTASPVALAFQEELHTHVLYGAAATLTTLLPQGIEGATDSSPWHCFAPGCNRTFPSEAKMTKHHENTHRLQYPCPKCGLRQVSGRRLQEHADRAHSGEEIFQCQSCDSFKTSRLKNLDDHEQKYHSDEVHKFTCKFGTCLETFYTDRDREKHAWIEHGEKMERPVNPAKLVAKKKKAAKRNSLLANVHR